MTEKRPPQEPEEDGDFARLKELIMWRLEKGAEERKELAAKVEKLAVDFQAATRKIEIEQGLMKIKVTGISAISAIVSGAVSAAVTAYELLKHWRP